jgi:thioester reductase-like protein
MKCTRLRESQPHVLSKVEAVLGDIQEPRLGISPDDQL